MSKIKIIIDTGRIEIMNSWNSKDYNNSHIAVLKNALLWLVMGTPYEKTIKGVLENDTEH